jgi:intracellular septation protein A
MSESVTSPPTSRDDVRVRDYVRPDFRVFEGFLPVLVFFVANRMGPAEVAIGLSFATAVVVFARNKSSGIIRALSVLGFVIVTASAVAGIVASSDKVFVAQNIVSDFAFVIIMMGSVLIGRPLIGAIARELVPGIRPVMAVNDPAFVVLTLVNGAINLGTGVARIFMLDAMSADTYAIVSRVAFIPLNIAFFVLCYALIARRAIAIWPADLPPPDMTRGR